MVYAELLSFLVRVTLFSSSHQKKCVLHSYFSDNYTLLLVYSCLVETQIEIEQPAYD